MDNILLRAILTFHSIDASGSIVSFDTRLFADLLALFASKAVPVCDLDNLLARGKESGIAITFDDGFKSVYRNALPILQAHQAPAHLFVTTRSIGGMHPSPPRRANSLSLEMLDWDEIEALQLAGIHIESHTHTHQDMRVLTGDQIAEECGSADELISSRLGRRPRYFAYPFGYHNEMARGFVRGRYAGAVTTELRTLDCNEDPAALPRLDAVYLRCDAVRRFLDTGLMRSYFSLRSLIRTFRGIQCLPDHN